MMTNNLLYLLRKLVKKLPGAAIKNSEIPPTSKVEARSTVINSKMGIYSYAGYGCIILYSTIGSFCSISDDVSIGLGNHPINWATTSPAFYYGRDSIPKDLACKRFDHDVATTKIGSDVWIGKRAILREGISIGSGAIIGMGAIVTKDIPPYAIAVGVPARVIGYRFDERTRSKLLATKWWDLPKDQIKKLAEFIDNVEQFIIEAERYRNEEGL